MKISIEFNQEISDNYRRNEKKKKKKETINNSTFIWHAWSRVIDRKKVTKKKMKKLSPPQFPSRFFEFQREDVRLYVSLPYARAAWTISKPRYRIKINACDPLF